MGNPQFSVFMPLFGKQWAKLCIAYTGKSRLQLMLFLQVWYVTHSKRSIALGIRLRISYSYGCLSQDLCLDCCTSNLSISWRERWWFGVHEANSTKWESQQHGNNNLKKPIENTMITKTFGFLFHVNIWCI